MWMTLLCLSLLSCEKDTSPATPVSPTYSLVWEENFNGTQLNTTEWYHRQPGVRHDGFNDETTVSLDGSGNLILTVYSDTIGGVVKHHTGMIATKRLFTYGKFEVRAAFTNESGSWSAYWLQSPTMGTPVGNPQTAGMEIDVVETLPGDGRVHHNLHWDGYGADHKSTGYKTGDLGSNSGQFHIYTLEWTPTYYKFFVDGVQTWSHTSPVAQRSEYIILSSEVRNGTPGSWAGVLKPGGYGSLKQSKTVMKVDYVRVYGKQ